jgi:hypothetical protein
MAQQSGGSLSHALTYMHALPMPVACIYRQGEHVPLTTVKYRDQVHFLKYRSSF